MGAIITSGQTRFQIDKTFNKLFVTEQAKRTKHYTKLFNDIGDAEPGPTYKEGRIAELGMAPKLTEGQRPALITPKEGNSVERGYFKRGLSIVLTEERMDDDIRGTWKQLPGQLNESIEESLEYDSAGLIELGNSTTTGEDGQTLFHATHPLINSTKTINNKINGALSATTLKAAFEYGKKGVFKENGFIMPLRLVAIVIHPDDEWVANDLLKQSGRVWDASLADMMKGVVTADPATKLAPGGHGARNWFNPANGDVQGWKIIVNPYLQSNTRWYALYEGYELTLRWKYRPRLVKDEDRAGTGNLIYTSKARYGLWVNKYKYILGGNLA